MIDINEIGMTYTVVIKGSKPTQRMFYVIFLDTFLELVGKYDTNHLPDYKEYMEDVVGIMQNFVKSPYDITWYARTRDESDISEAMEQALKEGNSFIVFEYLPTDDVDESM